MNDRFRFREGTLDATIFASVIEHNEYGLPESFGPDDVIVDIGMHIGSFCHAAAVRGAGSIFGFEAEPENFRIASENLAPHGDRVKARHQAVWRSDTGPTRLRLFQPEDRGNTGGGNVIWSEGDGEVEAVPLDSVLDEATDGGRHRVRFLKIDCEGSEFPILMTSTLLGLVDEIGGEYHEFGGDFDEYPIPPLARIDGIDRFSIVELTRSLQAHGFEVQSTRNPGSNIGLFRAVRIRESGEGRLSRLMGRVRSLTRRRVG